MCSRFVTMVSQFLHYLHGRTPVTSLFSILRFIFFCFGESMTGRDEFVNGDVGVDVENCGSEDEDYSYSDESLCSDEFDVSEVTNVTSRSSPSSENSSFFDLNRSSGSRSTIKTPPRTERSFSSSGVHCSPSGGQQRRKNMSFSNMEMMRIERDNQYLLRKIMAQQRPSKVVPVQTTPMRLSSSAINRKKLQDRIAVDNMNLHRRIQSAKSSSLSGKSAPRYSSTSL